MSAAEPTLPALTPSTGAVLFEVKVVPGASRTRVAGVLGTALKVAVSAPPEGGKANAAVTKLLAGLLGVKRGAVQIISGHAQPHKRISVTGISIAQVRRQLAESLRARD